MGEGSEGIAASGDNKNDGLDSCEANNVSCSSKKIAAFQRARWAKVKARQKKAAW